MVQRPAPKSSLDLLCEVALAPGDAIVSELVANDLRNEAEKAAKHAGSGGGVLDLDEILKLTPKQLVRHFTVFESNELRRTFKHTCRLVPYECQYETSSFGSEAKSVRDIKQHLQEHLELLKAQSTGRIKFTAETTVPIPRRLIEPRQGKKQPPAAKAPPRETRPSFIPEPVPVQPETPPKTAVSPKRALARRTSPPERPSRRVKAKRPRKRPVVESPPPELVSQPPEQQWGHTVEPLPPPPPSDVPAPAPVSPPPQPPPPPPPPPSPSPPRPLLREHDYARDAGAEVAPPSSGGGGVAKTLLSSLLEGALKSESVSADAPAAPGAVSVGASVQQTFEPDAALMGLMEREVIACPAVGTGGAAGQTEYSDGVPLVGAEQVVRAGQSAGVIRSGDLPVIMQGGSATIAGLRRYTRVVERDEYKEQRKPKGLAKFISQSEEDKEKARQALIEMRMRPSMCNNYVCRVCFPPQRFTALSSLQSHYKSHLGIKEFSCKLCQRSFTRKMSLDYHMLIHQHKTRYRCDTCGHEFRHKSHYTEHLRRHTGETPYVCSVCGQGFKAKNSYRRHLESKHGQRLTQSGNIVILSDDEHRRLRERSVHEERSRRRRSQPRPSDGGPAPDSPSKTGFSFVDVVVRQSTGRVEYMCNVDSAVPPLVQPTRDVLQQALDAALPEVQMLPPLTPEAEPRATEQDPLAIEQDLLATYPLAIEQQPQPQPKHEPREPLPARPRVNLTSSIGKYSVYYSSGNVANTLRIVRK